MLFVFSNHCVAAPHMGETVRLLQPDGTKITARAWGDEYYQHIESPNGYTLVRDEGSGWICYASLSADRRSLESTGIIYRGEQSLHSASGVRPAQINVAPGVKLPLAAVREIASANQDLLNQRPTPRIRTVSASEASSEAPISGSVLGLTLLIDFPDEPGTITESEVDAYLNSFGYNGFSNNGSIREYFSDVSNGNLDYTNVLAAYYTALHPKAYYNDTSINFGERARELILEALEALDADGFNFSQLSTNSYGQILSINVLYAGDRDVGWSKGLWPHQSWVSGFSADGVSSSGYQITNMGTAMSIGTFCHENGHLLMDWPDLYDYDSGSGATGIGAYGLMSGGSFGDGGRNPTPPNAYFRDLAGWETVTHLDNSASNGIFSHTANSNTSFKYTNPNNYGEHFWIESRIKSGRSASLPDEGLLIWHVDIAGNSRYNEMEPDRHFVVSVEQADGLFDLENERGADSNDLFRAGHVTEFNDNTLPNARWWDGSESGLSIYNIGPVGEEMEFHVGEIVQEKTVSCDFNVISDWDAAYVGIFTITNNGTNPVPTWELSWSFTDGSLLNSGWNANISGNNPYSATGLSWNGSIQAGASVELGIQVSKAVMGSEPNVPVLFGGLCN